MAGALGGHGLPGPGLIRSLTAALTLRGWGLLPFPRKMVYPIRMATSESTQYAPGTYTKGEGDSKQTRHVLSAGDAVSAVYDGFVRVEDLPEEVVKANEGQSGNFADLKDEDGKAQSSEANPADDKQADLNAGV